MSIKAAIRKYTPRLLSILAGIGLVLTALFHFPSSGSRSSAQLKTATQSSTIVQGAKVDPLLVKYFSLNAGATVPVVIAYKSQPSSADFSRLQSVGIGKGFALRQLPLVIAPLNAAQLSAVKAQPNVRSVWANRVMKAFTNESRPFIGVPQLMADAEITRANNQHPGMPISGRGVGIGYVDTGCDATHVDLKFGSKVIQNVIQPMSEATVGDGGLAIGVGVNVFDILYDQGFYAPVYQENQEHSDVESGHGTFGAAVAAGTGAQSGNFYGGVAPGANLIVVNSGNELGLPLVAILGAYDYLLVHQFDYNIRVINNSWGTTLASSPEALDPDDPINIATLRAHDSNITVVFAAGNDGDVVGAINPYSTMPWTISVAAGLKRGLGTPADFSSRGENNGTGVDVAGQPGDPSAQPNLRPDVTAPGVDIKSARMKGAGLTNTAGSLPIFVGANDLSTIPPAFLPFYTTSQGTSFACPHVSGVVALMIEANPLLTPDEVVTILRQTANPMPYEERIVGAGYVDAHNAVRRALGLSGVAHPFNLFPQPGGPEIVDPEGDQFFGTGTGAGAASDAQDILACDYAYDATNRQLVYTLTLKNASTRTEGMSWLMSSNFGQVNVYVTATATDVGTMSYTYGKIDNSTAVAQQVDLGDCDSGEVRGNQIIIRLSLDKLKAPEALGYDVVGKTSTATEALAQVGVGLLFAADIANGADFTVQ
ncbi:MAG TPA: S8 family serine peptidase [Pyrinomonadaceae bacterium]|nr:S8 family serine peptidase [Pyrinomonadaceae bacterium]